jgi:phosphoglycolate phosphatase-like HAD superfamily hydrolase
VLRPVTPDRRGVIFDVDGTVLDVWERYCAAYRLAAGGSGLSIPADHEIRAMKRRGMNGLEILRSLYPDVTPARLTQLDRRRIRFTGSSALLPCDRPVDGALATLHELRALGVKVAFVTFRSRTANAILRDLGLAQTEDVLVNARGTDKTEALRAAAAGLGLACQDCLVVSDSPGDIVAARRAGMTGVAVAWGLVGPEPLERAAPAALIAAPAQLVTMLCLAVPPGG